MINRVIYRDMRGGAIIKWKGDLYKRISRKHQFQPWYCYPHGGGACNGVGHGCRNGQAQTARADKSKRNGFYLFFGPCNRCFMALLLPRLARRAGIGCCSGR